MGGETMKRIIRRIGSVMVLFLTVFSFFGCSAATHTESVVFEDPMVYSYTSMSLNRLYDYDLASYASSPGVDLKAAIQSSLGTENLEWFDDAKQSLISLIGELSGRSGQSVKALFELSGSELNALAVESSLSLTVDDVIAFADLKSFIESTESRVYVTRKALFEAALGRTLSDVETEGLSDFQDYLSLLARHGVSVAVETMEEAALRTDLGVRGYSEAEITSIVVGYLIVMDLISINDSSF